MLKKMMLLLGISNPSETELEILELVLETASDKVKAYCHIDEISEGLITTVVRLATDIYRQEGYGNKDKPQEVTSVKRGDVSTSFAQTANTDNVQSDYLDKYKPILNTFRRLR